VFGEGKQYRPFVHIRDISRAIIKVLKAPSEVVCGEVFNVGSDEQNISIKELAEKIKQKIPDAELKFIKEKEDSRSYIVSFKKIREKLGFVPKYTIEMAINEIREAFEKGLIEDYKDKKYSNYKSLNEEP
ncbi:MAG: NAD-dependent epimerase/dehydratase family protein, partial [Candidatus Asgardarchaeia archaeon]